MLFLSAVTSALFASAAFAAPVDVSEDKRGLLSGLLGTNTQLTKLTSIVSNLQSTVAPLLSNIQSSVATPSAVSSLLGPSILSGTGLTGGTSSGADLSSLNSLVSGLSSTLSAGDLSNLQNAITNIQSLGTVTPQLQTLLTDLLSVSSQLATAQTAIQSLASGGGATGLTGLLSSASLVTNLTKLTAQLFATLQTLTTNLSLTLSGAGADVTTLNNSLQALQAPLDTALAGVINGSNTIATGLTPLLTAALRVTPTLQSLVTVQGVQRNLNLATLVSSLGLTNVLSALNLSS